jgi:hypothetical protein
MLGMRAGAKRLRKSGSAKAARWGWASGGRMRSVETVEWKLGTTNLIPLNLSLSILQGSTPSTVSTVSTIK